MAEFFLDSGAFSIFWGKVISKENPSLKDYSYYNSVEFWRYVEAYAKFVKEHTGPDKLVQYYANLDAIWNPELSWEMQQILEQDFDLKPVPVIHGKTDPKWIKHYLDHGYDLLGLGGMGQPNSAHSMRVPEYMKWADRVFDIVCDGPGRLPRARIHGFGITSQVLLLRYPWWSVDSTAWVKRAGFGKIFVPHYRKGQFVFDKVNMNYDLFISDDSPYRRRRGAHYLSCSPGRRAIVNRWLKFIGIPYGERDEKGNVIVKGVSNDTLVRCSANIMYFNRLVDALPDWPWPFESQTRPPSLL